MVVSGHRGQGATEYLVLLAVVLIVAMVAIALLGFFPGLSYDAKKSESDSYWRGSRPFQVMEHALPSGGDLTLVVRNVDAEQLQLSNVTVAGSGFSAYNSTAIYLSGGETKAIAFNWTVNGTCAQGSIYEFWVNFSYNSPVVSGQKQYGAKSLVGKCS